ncbi:MAG: phenylalanine--tRNA ligase subunit alpha [Ignavibacteriaceae bacterium]|nr:phenylalanine--tRNA ligase subunit alpha [Ignavibacteriaceae bacterium]
MKEKIDELKNRAQESLAKINDQKSLEEFRIAYLGRNGAVSGLFSELKNVPKEEKPQVGNMLNHLRDELTAAFTELALKYENSGDEPAARIDLSLPGRARVIGSRHLVTQTMDDIKAIFKRMGFSIYTGPEVESDYYNFEALNFPPNHPARDMQDTFFISDNFVLRTHTTPVQVRIMEAGPPPVRAIMPGKVYRNEDINARSHCIFHQIDGIAVGDNVTFMELKSTLLSFAKEFYGSSIKHRFRASFFPFTEPSAELDVTCFICSGKGCRMCKHSGWLEILGCGMVDPNVFKSVGYDPEKITGYAFGMGVERIGILKYGLPDIRLYFENDLRFLRQF